MFAQNIIRVNNNEGIDADYTTLQEAHDNAENGDIIYLEGSENSYGDCNISKKVRIIGTGYSSLSTNNSSISYDKRGVRVGKILFEGNSSGSIIEGVRTSFITLWVGNITILNNYISGIILKPYNASDAIYNCVVSGNYIVDDGGTYNGGSVNLIFTNNIVVEDFRLSSSSSGIIKNNIFASSSVISPETRLNNSIVENNIFLGHNNKFYNCTIVNNIFTRDEGYGDDNFYNINKDSLFIGSGDLGEQYKLKENSPAKGVASDGGDCGIFGGSTPFPLFGLPSLPIIYDDQIPTTATKEEGINVQVKIRTNN